MRWRNEQMYHLRQNKTLTEEDQDWYFVNVVSKLFDQDKPDQILFSYLKGEKCIGYGGLVHINWEDRNAEVSFVMDTELEHSFFEHNWIIFLNLIKRVAFRELNFGKIYTYAYDVRPRLYRALEIAGFTEEARIENRSCISGVLPDVLIHSFINPLNSLTANFATIEDVDLIYDWANDPDVRHNSLNSGFIPYENHLTWYNSKLNSDKTDILVFRSDKEAVGQVRLDFVDECWEIDYSIDANYRGLGLGEKMIQKVLELFPNRSFLAIVKCENIPSQRVFERLHFKHSMVKGRLGPELYHQYHLIR